MVVIDVHAHFVPAALIDRIRRGEAPPGVNLEEGPDGRTFLRLGTAPAQPLPSGMTDLNQRMTRMEQQGVDWQWLTLWLSATGYSLDAESGAAWSRMVNTEMARGVPAGSRFVVGATVPLQDGAAAARELEYALGIGLKGLIVGTHANGKSLDDPDLDPLWRVAAEARAPVMIHPFGLSPGTRLDRYHLKNLVGNPADTTIAAAQIVFGGAADRFPDLKILLVHGGGFFPYQFGRWDHGHDVREEARVRIARPPSDYLKWFYYDTVTHSPQALRYLLDLVGPDRVALGTDWPFDMADPNPRLTVGLSEIGPDARARVETLTPQAFLSLR